MSEVVGYNKYVITNRIISDGTIIKNEYGEKIMKKSFWTKLLGVALAAVTAFSMVACGDSGSGGNKNKKLDTTKTQVQVFTYDAGFGTDWLDSLIESFEAKYADRSFEEGKTGVQVWYTGDMKDWTGTTMKESKYDVFFMENAQYYSLVGDGILEDLSSIVTGENTDGKTILSKLDSQQTDFFGVRENGEQHYYALPSYIGDYGIIYNIELFDEKGDYIAADQSNGLVLGENNKDGKKSNGPDGLPNTPDDGLPATYEEFYALCNEIMATGAIPLGWTAKYADHHLGNLLDNLVSDYEGVEQMRLNYDFSGTATDLVVLDGSGKVTKDGSGKLVTESVAITTANGYELARQAGKYYAMEFVDTLLKTTDWQHTDSTTGETTQTDAQEYFLMNGTSLAPNTKSIAMLVDGPWWQAEATKAGKFEFMEQADSKYSATSRKFGWMPLPKANSDKVGSTNVFSDYLNAIVCLKNTSTVKEAALEFIKYSCTDEMLVDFTKQTGAMKGYKYEIPESETSGLSTFTKSYLVYAQNSERIYRFSSSSFYNNNLSNLKYDVIYSNRINGSTYKSFVDGIKEGKTNAKDFFESYYTYFKSYTFWK